MKDLHLAPKLCGLPKDAKQAIIINHYSGEPDFLFHFHPEYELVLTLGSRGRRIIGDTITEYAWYDFVLLGPNLPHTWASESQPDRKHQMDNCVVLFTRESIGPDFLDKREMKGISSFLDRSARGISFPRSAVSTAVKQMITIDQTKGAQRMISFLSILENLAACTSATAIVSEKYDRFAVVRNHVSLGKMLEYIHQNSDHIITLEEAAAQFRMSQSTFCRFFRRATGKSFIDYVNDWRVSRACGLLKESDYSILEISGLVGFNNLSHFNRQFLRRQGWSPRDYRRKYAKITAGRWA
ncbi:MAG: AraC family transcriptional regulator [Kiritimatiellae bacterium]|nr:AraC family transcriptional regulator [Kiritimatiellia bacterium]MDD5522450.1 AraC family transcriptional regulator [Kiritimatiellia bacterium]